jgi:hypothetical protein
LCIRMTSLGGKTAELGGFGFVQRKPAPPGLVKKPEVNLRPFVSLVGCELIEACRLTVVRSQSTSTGLIKAAEIVAAEGIALLRSTLIKANSFGVVLCQSAPPSFVKESQIMLA